MYKQFYGLNRNPFEITPDPSFYCPTPFHNEALATLIYGIQRRKGFLVVTGEVGTGKTLLIQCLLRSLSKSHTSFSHIFNTRLSSLEFLQCLLLDLGLPVAGRGKSELLLSLNRYLISRFHQGSTTVLIVDEGQVLDWEVLEEIRLLTNLETFTQKLLQIVLVGQPELDEKLDSSNLRQLKQRIAFRCQLKALSEAETRAYVLRRLELAGANSHGERFFPEPTIAAIMRHSRGIPRLINTICENALIAGFARQLRSISPEIIEQVAGDFRLTIAPKPAPATSPSQRAVMRELFRMIKFMYAEEAQREEVLSPNK